MRAEEEEYERRKALILTPEKLEVEVAKIKAEYRDELKRKARAKRRKPMR